MEPRIQNELDRIAQIQKARYLTRTELISKINYPDNSPNLVVIRTNADGTGFPNLREAYEPKYLSGLIGGEEFYQVLEEVSELMNSIYSKKRKMDRQETPLWYKLVLLLAIFIAVPMMFMAYYALENEFWFMVLTWSLLGTSFILVCGISLINFWNTDNLAFEDPGTFLDRMIQEKVEDYLEKINDTEMYRDNGLEWYLVPGHYWLELRISKAINNYVRDSINIQQSLDSECSLDQREENKTEVKNRTKR
ncbi:unnamed protein product [Moneuplotes crassus]|uniref:Uncharacterized protein n=1 Tax=Euplotes crassus TaxID=5936 RepID=A0AAD2D4D4_EUPCR|nr:unnamed protein product [Moneuplotes crassus]